MPEIASWPVKRTNRADVVDGGNRIVFDLEGESGGQLKLSVPFHEMARLIQYMQSAMHLAVEENAKRPGFDPAQYGVRLPLKSFSVGLAKAPGRKTMVVIQMDPQNPPRLDFIMPPDLAESVGRDLVANAVAARVDPGTKPM